MRANLLSASPGTVAGKSFAAQSFTRLLQLLNTQLADCDDAIASAVVEHPDAPIFASLPGVGPVLTGELLAEIGKDRDRFPTAAVLLAEAGLAPVTRASGRSRSVTPRTHDCVKHRCGGRSTRSSTRPGPPRRFGALATNAASTTTRAARASRSQDARLLDLLDARPDLRPGIAHSASHTITT